MATIMIGRSSTAAPPSPTLTTRVWHSAEHTEYATPPATASHKGDAPGRLPRRPSTVISVTVAAISTTTSDVARVWLPPAVVMTIARPARPTTVVVMPAS